MQSKMVLWIMAPVTALLALLFYLEYQLTFTKAYEALKTKSFNVAQMSAHIIETDFANTDFVRLQQNLSEIGKQEQLKYIYVVDQNGIYAGHFPEREKIKTIFSGKLPAGLEIQKKYLINEIQYVIPVIGHFDSAMGYLFVSYPLVEWLSQKKSIFLTRLAIVLAILFLILICVRFIAKRFSNPIMELKKLSNEVSAGNFDATAKNINTGDETEILAKAFNDMVAEIKGHREKLLSEKETLEAKNRALSLEVSKSKRFEMIGESPAMKEVYHLIERAAKSDVSVSITGETGCGKELVARAIHENSDRALKPFIAINCGALNLNLIEAELFGAEKGAYTGSTQKRVGLFEAAHGGTVFLDEIGDMPLDAQVKLFRVLQERKFNRVGGNQAVEVDVRIISATNKDLSLAVRKGLFREELLNRINTFPIHLPPLRERDDDVLLLIAHFFEKHREKQKKSKLEISKEAVEILKNRNWADGNIRGLDHAIERLILLSDGQLITDKDIYKILSKEKPNKKRGNGSDDGNDLKILEADVEEEIKQKVLHALMRSDWNITKAAQALQTNRQRIYRLISRYNLRKLESRYIRPLH